MKSTALLEEHKRLGAKLIDFGGWEMPVQYSGLADEHLACRTSAGLFDVSHMGEFHVSGPGAAQFLDYLLSNSIAAVSNGQAQYSLLCNANGGLVDDLVVYRKGADEFLVVVNASNTEKDFAHFSKVLSENRSRFPSVEISNESARYSQIALQGPKAEMILKELGDRPFGETLSKLRTYWFFETRILKTVPTIVARTGYTGEDGFEIYTPWERGPEVWRALIETGKPHGLKPVGLGARDTLRLEMKYPLYGNELSDSTSPLEAGLGWVTKLEKGDFVGSTAIRALKATGVSRKLVGFQMIDRGIPRHGYPISIDREGANLGEVTSGTHSPSLGKAIGIGYVPTSHATIGSRIFIEVRGQRLAADVVQTPFIQKPKKG